METLVWNNDMLVSAIILTLTFIAIFTEEIHKIHRVKSAMAGAAIMILRIDDVIAISGGSGGGMPPGMPPMG